MTPEQPEAIRVALRVIAVLEELGVEYHVGGSYASSIHGIPRQTQDIDLVVDLPFSAARAFVARLSDDFYVDEVNVRKAIREKRSFNLVHLASGFKVDLFVRGEDPFDLEEFARHSPELIQSKPERRVFIKSAEDTLLRKLQWYRQGGQVSDRQWEDILGIAGTQGDRLDVTYLEQWAETIGVSDLLKKILGSA
jgi:hypothetical protein